MLGDIIKLSRLRMWSDGSGISTLVAFWGCQLHCKYCANASCHEKNTPKKSYNTSELVNKLKQDDIYYKMTGGGVVFGGGEPLMQAEFIHEVCNLADPMWQKRIETSLYADWEKICLLVDDIDEWIIDIKDLNPQIYMNYTGKDNDIVIQNLTKLIAYVPKEKILIRVPYISGFNLVDNVECSVKELEVMGFTRIEKFEYVVL